MATFATNALHYRGIGSGIVRILADHPDIVIANDVDGKEFKVTIRREYHEENDTVNDTVNDTINAQRLSEFLGVSNITIKRELYILRDMHLIRYVGSKKTGHWEIIM